MDTQVAALWTVPETSHQMHLLIFPLFLPEATDTEQTERMDAAGPWPPFPHQDMEQTLPVQQFHHHAHLRRSCTSCPFSPRQMNFIS